MRIKVIVVISLEVKPEHTRIAVPVRKSELKGIAVDAVEGNLDITTGDTLDHDDGDIASVTVKGVKFYAD